MAESLVLELYHAIIQQADNTNDLLSLALCCLGFRDHAQRCLFRHVEPQLDLQHKQLISAINASPLRLGPLIRSFCIIRTATDDDTQPDIDAHTAILSPALRAMRNLVHLRNQRGIPTNFLQGCTFKLRTLVRDCHLRKSDLLFLFCDFLPTQHSIKLLQLDTCDDWMMRKYHQICVLSLISFVYAKT